MAVNYAYNFAEIDPSDNSCIGVYTTTDPHSYDGFSNIVSIPVYDDEYFGKYYINGNWYEDAEGTIPWQSSLL